MSSWIDYFSNIKGHYLKRAMFDVLQERYSQNEPIIDRLGATLVTESDMKSFLKLVTDLYEAAYMKAVNDHKEQLKKVGLVATIVPQSSKEG